MTPARTIAQMSLALTGMFEAELLIQLMLREWKHPRSNDKEFRNGLLETAAEILQSAVDGASVSPDLAPENVNLVAALCLAESMLLANDQTIDATENAARSDWLENVRRAVPSCFCDPDLLT